MVRYETLMLARTEITDDELSMIERYFDKLLADNSSALSSFDKWGKYRLAFPVQKNDYGVYMLARYEITPDKLTAVMDELTTFFKIKCNEIVMRHVTVRLGKNASSTYYKPEPIDIARSGNVDTFLKENKMEGLLSSVNTNQDGDIEEADESAE